MKCPVCGDLNSRVINSRGVKDGAEIRRRRSCDACSYRFTTYERAERAYPAVIKKDGRREPWNRDKILSGLSKACEKRPISIDEIEQLADTVGIDINALGHAEISSRIVGEHLMAHLRDLDEIAYVRFASVYRSFKDIDEFMSELTDLVKGRQEIDTQEEHD